MYFWVRFFASRHFSAFGKTNKFALLSLNEKVLF